MIYKNVSGRLFVCYRSTLAVFNVPHELFNLPLTLMPWGKQNRSRREQNAALADMHRESRSGAFAAIFFFKLPHSITLHAVPRACRTALMTAHRPSDQPNPMAQHVSGFRLTHWSSSTDDRPAGRDFFAPICPHIPYDKRNALPCSTTTPARPKPNCSSRA